MNNSVITCELEEGLEQELSIRGLEKSMKTILQTIDLKMTYQLGKVAVNALRGVNLEVGQGEFVAIMGPSGCGKSTMLHVLGGMLTPTSGRVIIDGEDMTNMTDAARTEVRRRKIGFVF